MLTYSKFLLILSFCIIAPVYAMKRDNEISKETQKANNKLLQIIETARDIGTFHFQEQDWENIKKCLEKGADPNLTIDNYLQEQLIHLAAKYGKKDLCDYLLQRNADINACDIHRWTPLYHFIFSEIPTPNLNLQYLIQHNANIDHKSTNAITSLGWAIYKDKTYYGKNSKLTETIKALLQVGASIHNIDEYGNTVFHIATNNSEKTIRTLITHVTRFANDETTNTIKTVLLAFNRLNNDPKFKIYKYKIPYISSEIQILILSKLLSPNFFHKGLYKQCKGENYQQLPLKLVNEHIQYLQQILQIKNKNNNETALQKLSTPYHPFYNPPQNIKVLLDSRELEKDLGIFNQTYPDLSSIPKTNLALQIFEKHYDSQGQEQNNV